MSINTSPADETPDNATVSETLRLLVQELNDCAETLRETHDLISPQLDELERRYPNAVARRMARDGQGSLGSTQGSDPA